MMTDDPLFSIRGRTVIITGGLGILGRQFTGALLARGVNVVVFDRLEPSEAEKRLSNQGCSSFVYVQGDVTSRPSLENAREVATQAFGRVDGLVNNAALDSPPDAPNEENGPFEAYPIESWDRIMAVNVKGTFLASQVFGGYMAANGGGSIVNIGSIYGVVSPDQRMYEYRAIGGKRFFKPVAYSASKSAIYNLTRYLATYWASSLVRVNTLTFAGVFNNQEPDFLKNYCPKVPLGRMARPDEYNGAIVFLLSDASTYMTGSTITLDGGFTAW